MRTLWNIMKLGLLTLVMQAGSLKAQMVQYGLVVEMNSGGKTLQGVAITVPSAHDCQPTMSGSNGVFRLNFGEHKIGDVVVGISARKHGYELVNTHIVREGYTLTDKDSLRVVMAPAGKVAEARARYYNLLEEAYIQRYDSTLSFLNEQYADHVITSMELNYWKSQAELELKNAYQHIEDYADRLARINEDDLDPENHIIYERMVSGNIQLDMAFLDEEPQTSVLDEYLVFSGTYPMSNPEVNVAAGLYELLNIPDSLYSDVMTLDNYSLQYESDFMTNGLRYAQSCTYLGRIFLYVDDDILAALCFRKALKAYELLEEMEAGDFSEPKNELNDLLNDLK